MAYLLLFGAFIAILLMRSEKKRREKIEALIAAKPPAYVSAPPAPPTKKVVIYTPTASPRGHIFYPGEILRSEAGSVEIVWDFANEPRFADCQFSVTVNGTPLPGIYWGRSHIWSPCGKYFTFERYVGEQFTAKQVPSSYLLVYSLERSATYFVAGHASPMYLSFPILRYRAGDEELEHVFTGDEAWEPVPTQPAAQRLGL